MTAKLLILVALCWNLLMALALVVILFIQRDTATHGQGPLNPHDLDSVRWMANGSVQTLWPALIGVSVTIMMLLGAARNYFSREMSQ